MVYLGETWRISALERALKPASLWPTMRPMSEPGPSSPSVPLRGWKEIAAHLGTSQRSAQRYASDLGMPVHRRGTRGASVAAYAHELDEWVRTQTPASLTPDTADEAGDAKTIPELARPQPALGASRRRLVLMALVGTLVIPLAWWGSGRLTSTTDTSSNVRIGLRLNGREMQVAVAPGTATSVSIHEGRSLWLTPMREGEDLRVVLRDGPAAPPERAREIGSVVLRPARGAPSAAVLFAFDDWTLELWWLPPAVPPVSP